MRKNAYIGISFILLVFGILFVPKIVNRIQQQDWVSANRLSLSQEELAYITLNGDSKKVPDFVLTNQDSLLISNEDYFGKVYLVEFFFTSCPTICPRMNVNMKKIESVFGHRDDFGIVSVTIDPKTDTPKQLKTYAEAYEVFSPNWHFLTGEQSYIYDLANRGFNIFAGINPDVAGALNTKDTLLWSIKKDLSDRAPIVLVIQLFTILASMKRELINKVQRCYWKTSQNY